MSHDEAKNSASLKALEFVKEGMVLGLGTGTTASFFIKHLIKRCQDGLKVKAVTTSVASEKMARDGQIPLLDVNTLTSLDLTIDGADEIDPSKRLIKGAGGALMREKIIATMSKEMIVIADESKLVDKLGKCPIPIEVIPFGVEAIKKQISDIGYEGNWRKHPDGSIYLTDNQNRILDISLPSPLENPEEMHAKLNSIPGVLATGFFFNLATHIVIGKDDGSVSVQT